MGAQEQFDRVLTLLHAAAFDDARWLEAALRIGELVRAQGHGGTLVAGHSLANMELLWGRIWFYGERREDWELRYFGEQMRRDERVPRLFGLRPGQLAHTRDLYTEREMLTSPVYNGTLVELSGQDGLHVRMDAPQGMHVVWVIGDSAEPGGWGFDQIELIERLKLHIRQCVVVRHALAEEEALGASVAELLDNTLFGVVQLDRRGRILGTNDEALRILREGDGLGDRSGFLYAPSPETDAELSRLLERALPPFGPGAAGSMVVERASDARPLVLYLNPVGEGRHNFRARGTAALALIVDPANRSRIDPALVAETLDLTPAEGWLAVELSTGRTLAAIAESTGRTEASLQSHLKRILRKQGLRRPVDLARRVLSLGGLPRLPR